MDSKRNAWCSEAGRDVLVVAERLVLRLAATAQGGSRQHLDSAVLTPDFDLARHQEGPVPHRRDLGLLARILLRLAVQPPVLQCAAWTPTHDLGHVVSIGFVRQDPRPAIELENPRVSAQAFTDVNANVQVKADLDVPPPIDLPHPVPKDTSRLLARAAQINKPTVGLL
jgi:hypothetical protein